MTRPHRTGVRSMHRIASVLLASALCLGSTAPAALAQSEDSTWSPWTGAPGWGGRTPSTPIVAPPLPPPTPPRAPLDIACDGTKLVIKTAGPKSKAIAPVASCAVQGPFARRSIVSNSAPAVAEFEQLTTTSFTAKPGNNGTARFKYKMWTEKGDAVTITSPVVVDLPLTANCTGVDLRITTNGRKSQRVGPSADCPFPGPYVRTRILSNLAPETATFPSVDASNYYADPVRNGTTVFRYQAWQADDDSAILTSTVTVAIPPTIVTCPKVGQISHQRARSKRDYYAACPFPGANTFTWLNPRDSYTLWWDGDRAKGSMKSPTSGGYMRFRRCRPLDNTCMDYTVLVIGNTTRCPSTSTGQSFIYGWSFGSSFGRCPSS